MSMNAVSRVDFPKLGLNVIQSSATIDILNHPAVKFIHGDIERDTYLENLVSWVKKSQDKISRVNLEFRWPVAYRLLCNVYPFFPADSGSVFVDLGLDSSQYVQLPLMPFKARLALSVKLLMAL